SGERSERKRMRITNDHVPARPTPGAARIGVLALLLVGLLGLPRAPLANAALPGATLPLQPVAQCVEAGEFAVGPYLEFAAADYPWSCGPTSPYPPGWHAAHIGAYPKYFAASQVDPTTCGTYYFFSKNVWYCSPGP